MSHRRRTPCPADLLPFALAALVVAPSALADGGGSTVAAEGVLAPGGKIRYAALAKGRSTTVNASRSNGVVVRWRDIRGHWAIPGVTVDGAAGGLSGDGRTLVLMQLQTAPVQTRSVFQVIRTSDLAPVQRVVLKGNFAFDALSPNGARLYLIQHVSRQNLNRYVVRAYALDGRRLLPGRIADRTQRGWVMAGYPVARATSAGGRWVYTFYVRPGGYPFVHALDTVRGVAHCVGLPWRTKQQALWTLRLAFRDGGRTIALLWPSGRRYLAFSRDTWRIEHPRPARPAGSGFPWWTVWVGLAAAAALAGGLGRRRIRGYALRARAATN